MSERAPGRRLEWDEGVASERTVLSWERTAISSLAVAALIVRAGVIYNLLGLAIPLAAMLGVAAVAEWVISMRLGAEHDRPFEHGAVLHDRALTVLAVVTVTAAVGSVALAAIR